MRRDRGNKLNVEILTVFDRLLATSDIPLHMTDGMIIGQSLEHLIEETFLTWLAFLSRN